MLFPIFYRAIPTAWFEYCFFGFESPFITSQGFVCYTTKTNAANTCWCIYKKLVNKVSIQAQRFKDLCTVVRTNCGNTHFGHNLHDATHSGFNIVLFCFFWCNISKAFTSLQIANCFKRQVWVDSRYAIAN